MYNTSVVLAAKMLKFMLFSQYCHKKARFFFKSLLVFQFHILVVSYCLWTFFFF